ATLVGCPADQVLVGSTGVIGVNLPMEKLKAGIPEAFAALSASQGPQAAQAIMTTDPFPKESCTTVTIGGMAKGSGMIGPDMALAAPAAPHATMLAFVTTDAAVPVPLLQRALL